jgi:type I restriction enzyme M protein
MISSASAAAPPDLTAALWRAYQQGQGAADAIVHLDYVLTLFLLKYLAHESPRCLPAAPSSELPALVVPEAAQFATLVAQRLEPRLGERLDGALRDLVAANPGVLTHVFDHVVFAQSPHVRAPAARDHYLQQQFTLLDALPLAAATQLDPQAPGRAASALLARIARQTGKEGSAWCTPPEVATLLARLLAPQAGERLSDPHCGSGALLGALAEQVAPHQVRWSGQERDQAAYGRCRLRLLLHGITHAQLELGDTITTPRLLAAGELQQFDVVVAQLSLRTGPWGQELAAQDPYHRFWRGVPPATQSDFAYISHVLATLHGTTGRAGLLVGHGALYRVGQDRRIRQQLLAENLLDAVIGLPAQVLPGVNSPLAILLFRPGRTRQEVLFLDASAGSGLAASAPALSADGLTPLVQAYHAYEAVPPYGRCVPLAELRANEYNLNLALYVPTQLPEPIGDLRSTHAEIRRLQDELQRVQQDWQTCLRGLGIVETT